MKLILIGNEKVELETKKDIITIQAQHGDRIHIDGHPIYKTVDDIEYEKKLKELEADFIKQDKGNRGDDGEPAKAISMIRSHVESVSKILRLDKTAVLNAIVRNHSIGWYRNTYQECYFPEMKTFDELKEEIKDLENGVRQLKTQHKKEILSWQQKITESKKLTIEKREVETEVEGDYHVGWVNCPFCDTYQDVSEHFDYEGGEANIECVHCGKIFSVKCDEA